MADDLDGVSVVDAVLGARVRQLRSAKQMSQAELGRRLGVSAQQVQKYERGANRISVASLIGLAKALDAPLNDLIGGIGVLGGENRLEARMAATPQADSLVAAFGEIRSPEVRAALLNLTQVLARTTSP